MKTKDINEDVEDKLYQPPKRCNALDDEVPECIYTNAGDKVTGKTEFGHELVSGKRIRQQLVLMSLVSSKCVNFMCLGYGTAEFHMLYM
jgi:hypothetical protein